MGDLIWTPDRFEDEHSEYAVVACILVRRRLYVVIETAVNPADPSEIVSLQASTEEGPLTLLGQVQSSQRSGGVILGRFLGPETAADVIEIQIRSPTGAIFQTVARKRF